MDRGVGTVRAMVGSARVEKSKEKKKEEASRSAVGAVERAIERTMVAGNVCMVR